MGKTNGAKVVASVTPLAVRADSRTFKQAASLSRLGYRSIVVEAFPSGFASAELPFELTSVVSRPSAPKPDQSHSSLSPEAQPSSVTERNGPPSASPRHSGAWTSTLRARIGKFLWKLPASRYWRPLASRLLRFAQAARRLCAVPLRLARRAKSRFIGATAHPFQFAWHLRDYTRRYFIGTNTALPDASLYYLHAFYQFPAVYWRSRFGRVPFIYDAHDFYSQLEDDATISSYWRRWVMPFELLVERLCVRRAAAVVTVNDGIAQLMRERFGCEPIIIRNAHDSRLDVDVDQTIREVIGLREDEFLIVSVGNWKPGMAIEEAIKAIGSLPARYHLAFLGGGFPCYGALAGAHGAPGRVHVLSPVAPNQVVPFIRTANAAIVLYYETSVDYLYSLPNRFFQPIAAGVPLLYPPLPEIRRLAERYGVGVMINPKDPVEIADGARKLAEDAPLLNSPKAGLVKAKEELTWQHEEVELANIVTKLIGPPDEDKCASTSRRTF